jgi:replication factor C subunit 3/5
MSIPWVEKYRPYDYKNIILCNENKYFLDNLLKLNYIPNLLLYGPPGTGKTTTIINLIKKYLNNNNIDNNDLIIHLNASDDRGIDIIRNQINNFVNSKTLFTNGIKFVILDEVDYMTKNAQIALKYLINLNINNIRFCLICNYISKIDNSLRNQFINLRFNKLPKEYIQDFLIKIIKNENVNIKNDELIKIIDYFNCDIRSMINYIQCNHSILNNSIISDDSWINLIDFFKKNLDNNELIYEYIKNIQIKYNTSIYNIIKMFTNYLISIKQKNINTEYLKNIEFILHINNPDEVYILNYYINNCINLFKN